MLTAIPANFGSGGAGLNPSSSRPSLRFLLEEHRVAIEALLAGLNPNPKTVMAAAVGILVSNTGAQNWAAYEAWRMNPVFDGFELFFGELGVYLIGDPLIDGSGLMQVPAARTLRGISPEFTMLRYNGQQMRGSRTSFIRGHSAVFRLRSFSASVRDGATMRGLLDYVVSTQGTLSPNSAGATLYAHDVYAQWGAEACWYGLNAAMILGNCDAYGGEGKTCYWLDGCSESHLQFCRASVWTEAALRNRGLYAAGSGLLNGGKLTVFGFVSGTTPAAPYGLDIDGTANCVVVGCTVEGANDASYYIHGKSTNVHMYGTRSNGGTHVIFDNAIYCRVQGGGVSASIPNGAYHRNNARNCRAVLAVETDSGHFDMIQLWGVKQWRGVVRDFGSPVISVDNVAPTDGYWEIGDRVIPRIVSPGQPIGWHCNVNGQPNTVTTIVTFREVGATGDTITRESGSLEAEGFIAGSAIVVSGSAANNVTAALADVDGSVITLGAVDLVDEGPVSCTIRGTGVFVSLGNAA